MQLVESGRLDLDADVNTYLDFSIPATFPEPVTLRNLMTHTSGFEDKGEGLFQLQAEKMSTLEQYLKKYLPERVFPAGKLGAYGSPTFIGIGVQAAKTMTTRKNVNGIFIIIFTTIIKGSAHLGW